MFKKTFSGIVLAMLLTGVLAFSFSIHSVKASSTIYIRADGSIDPPSPISTSDNVVYYFTDNINDSIVIEKSNIIVDGNGYALQGSGIGNGFYWAAISNVTIKNTNIKSFECGVYVYSSYYNTLLDNNVTENGVGIFLLYAWYSTIRDNYISANNDTGIQLQGNSSSNVIQANFITMNYNHGLAMNYSYCNEVVGNYFTENNVDGVALFEAENNTIYHNNFENNVVQAYSSTATNIWDDGYPSGGNYWSDYSGVDLFRGIYQDIAGIDGIGDTPYDVLESITDYYPLMGPVGFSTETGLNVTVYPTEDVGLIFENVTTSGSTTVNEYTFGPPLPPDSTLVGQYYNIKTSAGYSGNVTIRITYDDSNMTLEEENALQLLQWNCTCDVTSSVSGVPDGIVNMRDVGYFCSKFNTNPSSPNWDPSCDVTGSTGVPDGVVNMRDIGEACRNFMSTGQWVNVTIDIDTESNVIYGELSHLSMFGVTR